MSTQVIVGLFVTAALYVLLAVGLSLIFSVMRIINFAHAQMYMLGAYGTYEFYGVLKWPFVVAVVASAAVVGLLGLICERVVIRPVGQQAERAMISTLGLLLLLGGVALIAFGDNGQFVREPLSGTLQIGGAHIIPFQLVSTIAAIAIVTTLFCVLQFTGFGRALRAVAQDELGARLQGLHVGRIRSAGFALGTALAAVAGALVLPLNGATPNMGNDVLLDMFVIVVLGGLGSVTGAVVGGFLLALFQTVGVSYFGQFSIFGVYALVILVLLVRPGGILAGEAK